jgi:hypothetical protein
MRNDCVKRLRVFVRVDEKSRAHVGGIHCRNEGARSAECWLTLECKECFDRIQVTPARTKLVQMKTFVLINVYSSQ